MPTINSDEIRQRERSAWKAAAPGWKKWDTQIMRGFQIISDLHTQSLSVAPGQSVLDVATGTGEPALTIAKTVGSQGKVVGVDLSPEMLEVAREKAAFQGLSNVTFQTNGDEKLSEFQDATFDAVVCRLGLMLMPDPVMALTAFLRVLRPEGKASVSVPGVPDRVPAMALLFKTVFKHLPEINPPAPGTPGFFAIPSADMLRDIFTKAGFSNFNAKVAQMELSWNSAEEYWQMMSEIAGNLIPVLSKLPTEKKQAIENDVVESVRRMFQSGPVKLTAEVIVGTGSKPS